LAERLLEHDIKPVTVPGPADLEHCQMIPGKMLGAEDGYLDYFALAGVAQRAAFVIGNDTGPTHIAAHLGRPGLALYGGHTAPHTTGIQHTRFEWLERSDLAELKLETVWQRFRKLFGAAEGEAVK
jgi:ADP-heptose:LPS heptosyltransferase